MNVSRYPTPLASRHIQHKLAVLDYWMRLLKEGGLQYFTVELREEYRPGRVYAPDAFYVVKGKAFLLEMQITPLTAVRWAEKWKAANEFFLGGYYEKASWQVIPDKVIRPRIVVVSNQMEETIRTGCQVDIIIERARKILA